jgi:hypothetical protein
MPRVGAELVVLANDLVPKAQRTLAGHCADQVVNYVLEGRKTGPSSIFESAVARITTDAALYAFVAYFPHPAYVSHQAS